MNDYVMPKKKMTEEAWEYAEKADEMLQKSTLIPAINFEITDTEPDIFTSKIGGTPYVPQGMAIPTDTKGKQMKLLAQIDCELLAKLPDYPHEGMLQFWLSVEYPWEYWKIIYHESMDKSVTKTEILSKTEPFVEGETGEFPVINGGYGIETKLVQESMSTSDERYGKLMCKYLADVSEGRIFDEYDGDVDDLFDPNAMGGSHKIGGYHYNPQNWAIYDYDPEYKVDLGTDDEILLLFQLEYEHNLGKNWREGAKVVIGDCGVMYFFIKRKDLKALDFDKATYDWSCS